MTFAPFHPFAATRRPLPAADPGDPGGSFIIAEDFSAGAPDETWGESPLIDSTSLLEGVHSGYHNSADPWIDLGADYDELWVYLMRVQAASNDDYWGIMKAGWTPGAVSWTQPAFHIRRQWNFARYLTYQNNVSNGTTITGITTGVPQHIWVRCKRGTGSDGIAEVYVSTDGTRGTMRAGTTTGTLTEAMRYLAFNNDDARYDKIRVSASEIGDNGALV